MEASDAPDREVMTWTGFGEASRGLAQQVADSGFRPDVVLAIARGGLAVAGALAYALSVKNCFTMNVEFYTGVDQRVEMPVMLPPTLNMLDITGLRVLVADDVADTGRTLELVHQVIESHVGEARCAVLYQKPRSVIDCEYVYRRTDKWINFPWSTEDPIWVPEPLAAQRSAPQPERGPEPEPASVRGVPAAGG